MLITKAVLHLNITSDPLVENCVHCFKLWHYLNSELALPNKPDLVLPSSLYLPIFSGYLFVQKEICDELVFPLTFGSDL